MVKEKEGQITRNIRLRVSEEAFRKIFGARIGISGGIDKLLDKYSEKVDEDVLAEFLKERR